MRQTLITIRQIVALHQIAAYDIDIGDIDKAIEELIWRCRDEPYDQRAKTSLAIIIPFREFKLVRPLELQYVPIMVQRSTK